ncbi:MAG: hypothetical protein GF370_03710 [Candidatus Nealsonbacteria bacterium]|nr:hypothetical protein [Candidatus Nealsonbacteria bacterium]
MEKESLIKEAERLKNTKGKARGVAIKSHAEFILKEKGEAALKQLEEKMSEMGFPINYEEIEPMEFYPLYMEYATFLAIKNLFNFNDEQLRELGAFQTKISLIVRLFMKYFGSATILVKETPKMWEKYYTVGKLKVVSMDMVKRRCIIRLEDYAGYPPQCRGFEGYFSYVAKMVMNSPVSCREKKCTYKGDDCHEFELTW